MQGHKFTDEVRILLLGVEMRSWEWNMIEPNFTYILCTLNFNLGLDYYTQGMILHYYT